MAGTSGSRVVIVGGGFAGLFAARRLGLNAERRKLRTDLFVPPREETDQLSLF